MYHQPRRLVDDEQVLVLVEDVEIDRLRSIGYHRLLGHVESDSVAAENLLPGLAGLAVDADETLLDPLLDTAAGKVRQQLLQRLIEPNAGMALVDEETLMN